MQGCSVMARRAEEDAAPMDRDHLAQTLTDLEQEHADAEQQLAALQKRLDALRMTTEGMKGLLSASGREQPRDDPRPAEAPTATLIPEKPPTGTGALYILQTDPSRRWTPR